MSAKRSEKIIRKIAQSGKIANGYIFAGGDSQTKLDGFYLLASALNCSATELKPCNKCKNCEKIAKKIDPNVTLISKSGNSIKIDQIRELKEHARYGSINEGWMVVGINDAETMTIEASNSFLKLLEEPPQRVVFVLITEKENILPKTIYSRCQKVLFEDTTQELTDEALTSTKRLQEVLEKKPFDYIAASSILSTEEDIKRSLANLFTLFAKEKKVKESKAILEILAGLNRNANTKLSIDKLCFKLWKEN